MKFIKFKISDEHNGLELENGKHLDFHNDYLFINFVYRFESRYFEINLNQSSGNWVKKNDPKRLKLKFLNVQLLRIRELDQEDKNLNQFPQDDQSLSIIGFTNKDDKEFLGYLQNPDPNEENAIIIQTENGQGFIIFCDTVELELGND